MPPKDSKKSQSSPGSNHPSIQSFYRKEVQLDKLAAVATELFKAGDGFTEDELSSDPLNRKWDPEKEYEELSIDQLIPGPRAVTFVGRLVNLSTRFGSNPKQPKATGWHYMIIKDDSAAISVKLFFAQKPYPVKLGQLLTFWTSFILDNSKAEGGAITSVNISANMFPGRVTSDHVMIHTSHAGDALCRAPLEYKYGQDLLGLMTVDAWLKSGHDDVAGVKLLVCVKSIGATKKLQTKKGAECELMDVQLFDHTGETKITMWNELIESARAWVPGSTILLLSNPGHKVPSYGGGRATVVVLFKTMVEVDPEFAEAEWLRRYAIAITKNESLCLELPDGVWDVEAAEYGVNRLFFTLAELDSWVRSDGQQPFTGYINVTIMDMALASLHRRNMLMCAECCGVPIYANSLTIPCRNCNKPLSLSPNPRIIGTLVDETGCIAPGKLVWSQRAWEQLFGRTVEEIANMGTEEARWFEQRMLWLRMHLVVGWEENVGRLAVLAMKM